MILMYSVWYNVCLWCGVRCFERNGVHRMKIVMCRGRTRFMCCKARPGQSVFVPICRHAIVNSLKRAFFLCHLFDELLLLASGLDARSHDGVLAGHAATESAVELGTEGQLVEIVRLFFAQGDAL